MIVILRQSLRYTITSLKIIRQKLQHNKCCANAHSYQRIRVRLPHDGVYTKIELQMSTLYLVSRIIIFINLWTK